jgi:hypothetical protein
VTNFNCECVDDNDNLTLAQYRTKMLQRAGFAALGATLPPGVSALFTTFLQDAQDVLYRKYPALRTRRFFRWSLIQGERYYGLRENDENWEPEEATITIATPGVVTFASGAAPANGQQVFFTTDGALPTGLTAYERYYVINSAADTAQLSLTAAGAAIDTTGTQSGTHMAHVQPAASCVFNFEPYKEIEGAWLVDLNGQWLPMACGIPPSFYTTVNQPALPQRYEIRQCIEIFPAPQVDGYEFWIKGHFGKAAFSENDDKPTMNGELVYLWALANALDYYGKPSAKGVAEQAQDVLGQLIAGTHTGKRYIPGTRPLAPALMPIYVPGVGTPP